MDCLEFRRALYHAPEEPSEDFLAHRAGCAECAAEASRVQVLEAELRRVMEVPVPDGLAARIVFQHTRGARRQVSLRLAWTAGILLTAGTAGLLGYLYGLDREPALPDAVLAVVTRDLTPLTRTATVAPPLVGTTLAGIGARLQGELSPIFHAKKCNIRGEDGVHLVLQGERGRVTVFLLPNEPTNNRLTIDSGRFNGLIVPADRGSVVVLGEPGEPLDRALERVHAHIAWK